MSQLLTPAEVEAGAARARALEAELSKVLIDQNAVVSRVVVALLARGHVLLEGLPGLGKTELCKGIARLLDLPFKRLQFTPDLLPGDITGTYILEGAGRDFTFRPGPIFASVVLADEINRASPKTQSALLEAMQERRVTVLGTTHTLPDPFFVLATQNPIELEGTYPLPEAQLDRFLFKVHVKPVGAATLSKLLTTRLRGESPELKPVTDLPGLQDLFAKIDRVHLPEPVANYVGRLVAASDPKGPLAPEAVKRFVRWGASPRAALSIAGAARALALLKGKPNVGFDEVAQVASDALNHRLVLSHEAALEGLGGPEIAAKIVAAVPELERS
ncbi:MAG: AAA family ATPase [Deltaproteobacteria bacterium]|nr:AAA family ATPase [Deltaproteobacteria bacterium]